MTTRLFVSKFPKKVQAPVYNEFVEHSSFRTSLSMENGNSTALVHYSDGSIHEGSSHDVPPALLTDTDDDGHSGGAPMKPHRRKGTFDDELE